MSRTSILVAAAALSMGILAAAPVSATTLSGNPLPVLAAPSAFNVGFAANRHRRVIIYDRRIHGPRFASRNGPYRFRHGGWWYCRPWWVEGPDIGVNHTVQQHVAVCAEERRRNGRRPGEDTRTT